MMPTEQTGRHQFPEGLGGSGQEISLQGELIPCHP
jgi:hypothetical protein